MTKENRFDRKSDSMGVPFQKRMDELKKGDVFRILLGEEENCVTYTLLKAEKIAKYPGLRLTVRRQSGQTEDVYGRPHTTVAVERNNYENNDYI